MMGRKESRLSPSYWFNKRVDLGGHFLKRRILDKDQFGKLGVVVVLQELTFW